MVVGELAHEKDVVIIGGGPGGYHAAIRAAQLGKKVTLIEKRELGGVCLNEGCIPSKVFTAAASRLNLFKESDEMGIGESPPRFDYQKLRTYQKKVISQLQNGVKALLEANKIELINGIAYFLSENRIGVEIEDHYEVLQFNQAIIATGSQPSKSQRIQPDGKTIFHSGMLSQIHEVPSHLLVYGSNEIALEMAVSFQTFGSEVTILLEKEDFGFDSSIEKEIKRILKKKKIQVLRNIHLVDTHSSDEGLLVELNMNGEKISLNASHLLLSVPRIPNTKELGIEKIGVASTETGYIQVNEQCQTTIPTIFAVGDVTDGPTLAAKAIMQGKVAAEAIAGKQPEYDSNYLPKIVHFQPPIASVGLTEEMAKSEGLPIKVGQFPLASNGFATLLGKKDGFVKVITHLENETVLGFHLMGEGAIELISSGILSLEMVAREEDLKFPFYPHPSINEGLLEAMESLNGEATHLIPRKTQKKVTT
jgi:dihydrolipoamide dehydrogenase